MRKNLTKTLPIFLLTFVLILGGMRSVYASDSTSTRIAKSGDVQDLNGGSSVDVSGAIEEPNSSDITTGTKSDTTTSSTTTVANSIGGKQDDPLGKGVKTGDILTSSKTVAILFLGVGCLFLILRKKNGKEPVRE